MKKLLPISNTQSLLHLEENADKEILDEEIFILVKSFNEILPFALVTQNTYK